MGILVKRPDELLEPHPKFQGGKLAVLVKEKDSSQLSTSILEVGPKVEIPIHSHETQWDSIYVVSGKGEVFLDGKWHPIEAGDYILIPPGEPHGVKNTQDEPLKLFVVHSPPLF